MSNRHPTNAARPVNPNLPMDPPADPPIRPGFSDPGGHLPGFICYPVSRWADHFGVKPRTINEWIDKYGIGYYLPGNERLVTPDEMLRRMPYFGPDHPPENES